MPAAALALLASFTWGSSNFIAGLESRLRSVWTVTAVSQVAAAVGAGAVLLVAGGRASPYWAVFDTRLASACVILIYFVASRRRLDLTSRAVPALVSVGLFLTVANALFTLATTLGYLSIVSILGSLSPVVTTGLAQVFLHERLSTGQWAAVVAVFMGVILLTV